MSVDDVTGVHPETLEHYYGVDTVAGVHGNGLSGAGHPSDEYLTDTSSDMSMCSRRDSHTTPDNSDV
jgi:hypothetical protein